MATSDLDDEQFEQVAQALERWLGEQATGGTPELVLVGLLRGYADVIEEHGHIPRSWNRDARQRSKSGLTTTDRGSMDLTGSDS